MVLIIPPGRQFTPFEKLIYPFRKEVWLSMINTIFVTVFMLSMYKLFQNLAGRHFTFSFIEFIIIIVGGSQTRLPLMSHERITLVSFLLFTFVVRSLYLAALFGFMKSDKCHNPINSVDEMIESEFTFYMYPSFAQHFRDTNFYSR
jgi:hypothetical protein